MLLGFKFGVWVGQVEWVLRLLLILVIDVT